MILQNSEFGTSYFYALISINGREGFLNFNYVYTLHCSFILENCEMLGLPRHESFKLTSLGVWSSKHIIAIEPMPNFPEKITKTAAHSRFQRCPRWLMAQFGCFKVENSSGEPSGLRIRYANYFLTR